MTVSSAAGFSGDRSAEASRRLAIGFLNWAHALDHFVILIYPTVVIELAVVYGSSYATLIALSTASFVAFGLFSLPAGWLGDHWSRRNLMIAFYFGCGVSLVGAALAPSLTGLAIALFSLGLFAAIYHPVGTAMIVENAKERGRTLAFNGVCGNLGVSLAAGITAALTAALSWRGAFLVPGIVCIATGAIYCWFGPPERRYAGARSRSPDVYLTPTIAAIIFALFVIVALSAGLVFNTISVALPKIVDERIGNGISLVLVGGLTTAVFLCGAAAQITVGRLVERIPPHILFAAIAIMQFSARLYDGGDLRPDHGQRFAHRALYRGRLARTNLCGALFHHVHDLRRRGGDDRGALWPRRLRPRARHHRDGGDGFPCRRDHDRDPGQRRREGAAAAACGVAPETSLCAGLSETPAVASGRAIDRTRQSPELLIPEM